MSTIDLIFGIPLLWAAIRGFNKGLILELATLVGLVAGLWAGIHFSGFAADLLRDTFNIKEKYLTILSFSVVFVLVILAVISLGKLLEKSAEALSMGFFNKLAGALFSVLKTALILSFILFIINGFMPGHEIISKSRKEKSFLYGPVSSLAPLLLPKIKSARSQVPELKEI
ncbi:MAG: CvpA family protein [Bacteroidetes bacterium]|nr:CvpA family protein [Bacteroidota bacterium]